MIEDMAVSFIGRDFVGQTASSPLDSRVMPSGLIRVHHVSLCDGNMVLVSQLWIKLIEMVGGRRAHRLRMGASGLGDSAEVPSGAVTRVGFG